MLYFYLLSITQIVLESFPVSSSGHLQLCEKIFHYYHDFFSQFSLSSFPNLQTHDSLVVYRLLHGITVLVFVLFFYQRWFFLLAHVRRCWRIIVKCMALTFVADSCTALFYILFHFVFVIKFPLVIGFIITSGMLLSLIWCPSTPKESWSFRKSIILGCMQGIALLPGISRMASTYVVARWLHIPPRKAFEISCLIELPLIAAAFGLTLVANIHNSFIYNFFDLPMLFVMMLAGCVAYAGLYLVAYCAEKERIYFFGLYMVIPIFLTWWFS